MDDDILILNGVTYTFNITLANADGMIVLPKSLFQELYLEESFGNWPLKGYLVFNNSFEQLERYQASKKIKNSEFFNFRMDGSDIIIIEMEPQLRAESSKSKDNLEKFPVQILKLSMYVSIYDSEDLSQELVDNKYKKLYFWDYNYNVAISSNQRVSCGEYLAKTGVDVTVLNNENRQVLTGNLLKYICTDKLEADVSDDWDTCSGKLFFASNPSSTLYDDMQYILNSSYEGDGFPLWFRYDRFNHNFALTSYKTLFERYPSSIRERIIFSEAKAPAPSIAPIRHLSENTWSIPSFSDILSYKYTKMSAADNVGEYNSRMINGYSTEHKKFITSVENGYIGNAKEKSKDLLSSFYKEMQQPLFIINEDKLLNKKVINTYTLKVMQPLKDILQSYVLLNDAVYFELLGLPNRTPGTFIEIDSDSDGQGAWEDRFLGTWFVISVTHTITSNGYINNILAVKLNIPNSVNIPDGSISKLQNVETVEVKNAR